MGPRIKETITDWGWGHTLYLSESTPSCSIPLTWNQSVFSVVEMDVGVCVAYDVFEGVLTAFSTIARCLIPRVT